MQQPEPRLHLVLDPSDPPGHTRFVQALANVRTGRVVCEIRPDGRGSLAWLADSLLRALDKKPGRAGNGRNAQLSWRRALAWSAAADIRRLFVTRAHLLTRSDLQALVDLAALADCDLWLIQQSERPPRQVGEALGELPLRRWSFEQFQRRWEKTSAQTDRMSKEAKAATVKRRPVPSYNELPSDEFPTFLAACKELLPANQFREVEADFERAFHETARLFDGGEQAGTQAAAFVLGLLESRQTRPEMVVALRAAQVAFFHERYLLKADIDRLLAQRATALDDDRHEEVAAAVASYASTTHAAAAALCFLQRDPSLREAAALTVGEIAADGSLDGSLPDELRTPLRAHRLMRLLDGAADHEPLFLTETKLKNGDGRSTVATSARGLQRLARVVTRETGLPLVVRYEVSRRSSERSWILAVGLCVQPLRPLLGERPAGAEA